MKITYTAVAVTFSATATAGPLAYAVCQTACATTLGLGPAGPAAYAACQSACAPLLAMPYP